MPERSTSNWPSRLEWGLIVAFWATFALFSIGHRVLDPHEGPPSWDRAPIAAGRVMAEYVFWVLITPLVFRLVEAFPIEWPKAVRHIFLHAGLALAVAIGVDLGEDMVRSVIFPMPDRTPQVGVLQTIRRFWFLNELVVYIVILVVGVARSYYLEKREQQEQAEQLEARTQALEAQLTEARLAALRMQLNPHFLFNTLHAVSTLVGRDPQGVRRMIARLSELLRRVLDEEAPQEVALADELDFLDDYLDIQKIRFQGRIDVDIDVPQALQDVQVPNLILQPLVENAIKHGASRVRGTGHIEIRGRREGDRLVLCVRDNGPGIAEEDIERGVGLRNVQARLRELYGDAQTLRVEPAPGDGVVATIELPYHTGTDLYTIEEPHVEEPHVKASADLPNHAAHSHD